MAPFDDLPGGALRALQAAVEGCRAGGCCLASPGTQGYPGLTSRNLTLGSRRDVIGRCLNSSMRLPLFLYQ